MDKHLHIVSLTVPYPVNYGGVYDIFYKLTALHKAGIKIHLHCFTSGDKPQPELNKYCEEVFYYPREKGLGGLSFRLPYIVSSRSNKKLLSRLLSDNYPILIEGIHCSYLLTDSRFSERKVILRMHNVEYTYYKELFAATHSFGRKIYYLLESVMLKKYEKFVANKASVCIAVSVQDINVYRNDFKVHNIHFLPVFTGFGKTDIRQGTGNFCLYHGNLSVAENEKAALWLLKDVFNNIQIPLIIAGKDPSRKLLDTVKEHPNATIISNPADSELKELISNAQCHVLPSFNTTGVKLKLINSLFNGRHCIVNSNGVKGSNLEPVCHITDSANGFKAAVRNLFGKPLSTGEVAGRSLLLETIFNSDNNCQQLIHWIW